MKSAMTIIFITAFDLRVLVMGTRENSEFFIEKKSI